MLSTSMYVKYKLEHISLIICKHIIFNNLTIVFNDSI